MNVDHRDSIEQTYSVCAASRATRSGHALELEVSATPADVSRHTGFGRRVASPFVVKPKLHASKCPECSEQLTLGRSQILPDPVDFADLPVTGRGVMRLVPSEHEKGRHRPTADATPSPRPAPLTA
jgi:hypothetical protein